MKFFALLIYMVLLGILSACQSQIPEVNKTPQLEVSNHKQIKKPAHEKIKPITGIDISKYQGSVQFERIKKTGAQFVFIRATEGITYQDPNYQKNYAAAKAAQLTVGAYHFYETNDDPIAQLDNFKRMVKLKSGDLAPVIDIEKLHQQDDLDLSSNLIIFLNGLEQHYRIKPIIYSGENFANKFLTNFGDYPLWLAEYDVENPKVPIGWNNWTFWQWSQSGTINGIVGEVDQSRFNGDEEYFRTLIIKELNNKHLKN